MVKDTTFIPITLIAVKELLREVGFQKIKLTDIVQRAGISKSRLFEYFGGMYGPLSLVIYSELSLCYAYIYHKTTGVPILQQKMEMLVHYRAVFIAFNPVLRAYYQYEDKLSKRCNALRSAVGEMEKKFVEEYINKSK